MDTRSDDEIRGDLSYLFDKASHVLTTRMSAALAEVGVTPRGYCVLAKAMPSRLTQGELAELALLDKTTMVVTLDHLEAAGLARRRPSPTDRRARIVETTEEGVRVVEQARAIIDGVYSDVLGALSGLERTTLLDALVRLVGAGGPLSVPLPVENMPRRRAASSSRTA